MQDNPSQRPSGREDKRLQRAVLALVLHEFPAQLNRDDLHLQGTRQRRPDQLRGGEPGQCRSPVVRGRRGAADRRRPPFEWLEDS